MLKITVVILSSIISTVILQQAPNQNPNNPVLHPYQTLRTKSCNRRSNTPIVEDQWIPNAPQSLTQNSFIEQSPFLTSDDLLKESRSATREDEQTTNDKLLKAGDKNCEDDEDCDDNVVTTTAIETVQSRRKNDPLTSREIEERTVELIKDCLSNKNYKSSDSNDKIGDTRRSFKEDENHYSRDGSSEESITADELASRTDVETMGRNNKVMLTKNPRVCFACSSASNPTCWAPNRRTTIKYCNKDHASCVTKTFGEGASLTVIRDCASSCSDSPIPGIEPRYKKCSVCHSDLCNSAYSIKSYNILYVILILTGLKFTF